VRTGIRDVGEQRTAHLELIAYAKEHCGAGMVGYLFKKRATLSTLIADVWNFEEVHDLLRNARMSRTEAVRRAADLGCECGGDWMRFVVASALANSINLADLCRDVWVALENGRSEACPVVVLAGAHGGEGKSTFLKPLARIFGGPRECFGTPAGRTAYPLADLPEAKVALLDEFRFGPSVIPYATQCLWLDGSPVPVARPQNGPAGPQGHAVYKGTAPIFVTTKLSDLEWLEGRGAIDPATGRPFDAEASMLLRRLRVYKYTQRVPAPPRQFVHCQRCFARLVVQQASPALVPR